MKEFAKKGYDKASTDDIVNNANVSKGLLFHYFKNKKQLYLTLCEHAMEIVKRELHDVIDKSQKDLFVIMDQTQYLKLKIHEIDPSIYPFLTCAYKEQSKVVAKHAMQIFTQEMQQSMGFLNDIEMYKFKEGIDKEMIINMLVWIGEGYLNSYIQENDLTEAMIDKYMEDYNRYLQALKENFYREEYL